MQRFLLILAVTLVTPNVTFVNIDEKHDNRSEDDEDPAETVPGGATHVCINIFFQRKQGSISSTLLYARVLCTNVVLADFSSYMYIEKAAEKMFIRKIRT